MNVRMLSAVLTGMLCLVVCDVNAQCIGPTEVAPPGVATNDELGAAVAVDGDVILMGAPGNALQGNSAGRAYIMRWTGDGWDREYDLIGGDVNSGDRFGEAVAIDGNTAVVGAPSKEVGNQSAIGAVYVFTRSGSAWLQQAKLVPPDDADRGKGVKFGQAVAVSGDTIAVGAPGVGSGGVGKGLVYVYTRRTGTWTLTARLRTPSGSAGAEFGRSLDMTFDRMIIGEPNAVRNGLVGYGAAYISERVSGVWGVPIQLNGLTLVQAAQIGSAVSIDDDVAIVGLPTSDFFSDIDSGSTWVFRRTTSWAYETTLRGPLGTSNQRLGSSVNIAKADVDGLGVTYAWVGSPNADGPAGAAQGVVTLFQKPEGGSWSQVFKTAAPSAGGGDRYGSSVSASSQFAVVASPFRDPGGVVNGGAAFVSRRIGTAWEQAAAATLQTVALENTPFAGALSGTLFAYTPFPTFGSPDTVYVQKKNAGLWSRYDTLEDPTTDVGYRGPVSIGGTTVAVRRPITYWDDNIFFPIVRTVASIHLWRDDPAAGRFLQERRFDAPDPYDSSFGDGMAMNSTSVAIGSPKTSPNGTVLVYNRSTGALQQTIIAPFVSGGFSAGRKFGCSIAFDDATLVIGDSNVTMAGGFGFPAGGIFIYERSGGVWTLVATFVAGQAGIPITCGSGSETDLGANLALSGSTIAAGVGCQTGVSRALIFTKSGSNWIYSTSVDAQLIGGTVSVVLQGDKLVIGVPDATVAGLSNIGGTRSFLRTGAVWTAVGSFIQPDPLKQYAQNIGLFVGLDGDDVLASAPYDGDFLYKYPFNSTANANVFPQSDCKPLATILGGSSYSSLADAVGAAAAGKSIRANPGAFRSITGLNANTSGLTIRPTETFLVPRRATISLSEGVLLGGTSSNDAFIGTFFNRFTLPANAAASIQLERTLTFGPGSDISLQPRSSLSLLSGTLVSRGSITVSSGALLQWTGLLNSFNSGSIRLNNGSLYSVGLVNAPGGLITGSGDITVSGTLINRGEIISSADLEMFGNLDNRAGGLVLVQNGDLTLFGTLTNSGTIVGDFRTGSFAMLGDTTFTTDASLMLDGDGGHFAVAGNFDNSINDSARFDAVGSELRMIGLGQQTLEVMSTDRGPLASGLDRSIQGNFPIMKLRLGPTPTTVSLVDARDNDGLGQASCESIYVDTLQIDAGSTLVNTTCRIYYRTLINNGTVTSPANLVPLLAQCPADFNADGFLTFEDFDAFVAAFESGDVRGDFNADGFITFEDFDAFVGAFESGC